MPHPPWVTGHIQNDFSKQRYITLNAISPGQDRINPNNQVCRTNFAEETYDTDHGYRKEMARENVCCVTYSCQFISVLLLKLIKIYTHAK